MKNNITIFGAGRSSIYLIEYLAKYGNENQLKVVVADKDTSFIQNNLRYKLGIDFINFDVNNEIELNNLVSKSIIVISLLPPFLHLKIAQTCLKNNVSLTTASYVSEEMRLLNEDVKSKGLIFLNEIGLDPGIDHLSAMKMIDNIKNKGGEINSFESYCGGLVSDESDKDNPWKYKFSWNPSNVVLAGQGGLAKYKKDNKIQFCSYSKLFEKTKEIEINGKPYDAYFNRDSLAYIMPYGLESSATVIRGTLRKRGYCNAWDFLVKNGFTESQTQLSFEDNFSIKDWFQSYFESENIQNLDKDLIKKLNFIGLNSEEKLPFKKGTSAQILESILLNKWKLEQDDKDMIVMQHVFRYSIENKEFLEISELQLIGEDNTHTAMSKTVGLPLAMASKLIIENKINSRGIVIPTAKEFYDPILKELERYQIKFSEELKEIF